MINYDNYDEFDYMIDCEEERLVQEHLEHEEIQRNYEETLEELNGNMNFLQKMAYETLTSNMEVALFMTDDEIRKKVIQMSNNNVLREFFSHYTTGEILDIIEQTMESND